MGTLVWQWLRFVICRDKQVRVFANPSPPEDGGCVNSVGVWGTGMPAPARVGGLRQLRGLWDTLSQKVICSHLAP